MADENAHRNEAQAVQVSPTQALLQNSAMSLMSLMKVWGSAAIRILGPVFVLLALSLISGIIFVYYRALLPYYWAGWRPGGIAHLLLSVFLSANIFYNYTLVVLTKPGSPPDDPHADDDELRRAPVPRRGEGFSRYCKQCKRAKPPRSHHCHVCRTCVLRMDHHCPWINNCVGFRNHRFFTLFMLYLLAGCVYVMACCVMPLLDAGFTVPWADTKPHTVLVFCMCICGAVSLALVLLGGWHVYLAASAQTTIEFYFNMYRARLARQSGHTYHNE